MEILREVGSLLLFHEGGERNGADPWREQDFSAGEVFGGPLPDDRAGRARWQGDVWRADDLTRETPVASS